MAALIADLKYAWRGLLARPLFVLVATLSLGLGIGVNTAIYSLYHQVVLRELPVPEAGRLVNLASPGPRQGSTSNNSAGSRDEIFSYPMFRDLERQPAGLEGIAAHRYLPVDVAFRGQTRSGTATLVSGQYFSLLQLQPVLGRLIGEQDDQAVGGAPVAVLSHAYWRNQLGAAPDVVNQVLRVNGQSLTIIGVAPEGFSGTTFGAPSDVFVPITQRWSLVPRLRADHEDRNSYWVYLFGRLAPGAALHEAETRLNGPYQQTIQALDLPLQTQMTAEQREQFAARRMLLSPGARGQSSVDESARTPMALMLAAAALVLLIACLNLANLMLARGAAKEGEVALRASIGASRARLVQQLLAEALALGLLGAIASLPLASATMQILATQIPMRESSSFMVAIDGVALQASLCLALTTVLLFGLFPAWRVARTQPVAALRGSASGSGGARTASRFRSVLAITQVALSMAALGLAGLFLRSLDNLDQVELGLNPEPVAMFVIAPERSGYTAPQSMALFDRLEAELAAIPGVRSVASSMVPILAHNQWGSNISLRGFDSDGPDDMNVLYNAVGPDFFRTFEIPLLAGRVFEAADSAGRPKVAVINRAFAERFRLGPNPVGERMAYGDQDELDIEIVGLVEDSKYSDVREDAPAQVFFARRQEAQLGESVFYLEADGDPAALLPQITAAVAALDPNLPVQELQTFERQIEQTLGTEHFVGTLSLGFALLATGLAALGLYGVLNYTVAQRQRELGLRLALGAAPVRLRTMVLRQMAAMTAVGAVLGLIVALVLGRAAQALLFGLQGHDPMVMGGALLLLAVISMGAGWWPARRAMRVDPAVALRSE